MRFNKRASLEIGVNTIVILVIAMTLLGLGVVFVRSLFAKVGGTVDIIEPGDISNPPTADKPIRLVPGSISIKSGSAKTVDVLVYNKAATQDFTLTIDKCTGLDEGKKPYIEAIGDVEIEQGSYKGFKTSIYGALEDNGAKGDSLAPDKRYICQITARGSSTGSTAAAVYSEQFTMDVTS